MMNVGKIVQIIGPVIDIRFENGHLPNLLNAIEIVHEGKKVVCEVAQQIGDDVVRCIAMSSIPASHCSCECDFIICTTCQFEVISIDTA